jgi:hypothetical protein
MLDGRGDGGSVRGSAGTARLDAAFDTLDGVMGEQLQHANVLAGAGAGSEPGFEFAAEIRERCWELPVAVDRGMVERGWLAFQNDQKMQRIEHFFAVAVAPPVRGNHLAVGHDLDVINVALHGHRTERPPPRHTVTVAVERRRLVFVHLAGLEHTGIERTRGNR